MLRALRPKPRVAKFHVHDSVLFSQPPQTTHLNSALLRNETTGWVTPDELPALQRSFETLLRGYNVGAVEAADLKKLYCKVYYPFLTQQQLKECVRDSDMTQLQRFVIKHARLTHEGSELLKRLTNAAGLDFGVLRGEYFASLGLTPVQYGHLLRSANKQIFEGHDKQNYNFSKVISKSNGVTSSLNMERYLKSSSSLHRSTNLKNYLVVNSPEESEMFANLAQQFGTSIVILTGTHFQSDSLVAPLIHEYQVSKLRGSVDHCTDIRSELQSLQFLPMKDVQELIQFTSIIDDVQVPSPAYDSTSVLDTTSFEETLRQMEISILGNVETNLHRA